MKKLALGIDIGGSSAKLLLLGEDYRVEGRRVVSCDRRRPWRETLGRIAEAAAGFSGGSPVHGTGIGCSGLVDRDRGVLSFSPTFPLWKNVPLRDYFREKLGLPCVVDNDVNMVTLGEYRHGAGRGGRNVVCLTLGTGVGGGLVIGGRLYRGAGMSAGELGHITVEPHGLPCPCGNRGCLEQYVGAEGLVRLARLAARGGGSVLKGRRGITPLAIETAAKDGDRAARLVWERAGYYLGLGLAAVVNLLNPDIVVVGGGIARAGRLLLGPARRTVRERALRTPSAHARILRASLDADAGPVGAASEVFDRAAV